MGWLGLDIGGANLKLADGRGYAESQYFPLWRDPHLLTQQLRMLIAQAPPSDHLAITMTGELADCFDSKVAGVQFILDAAQQAADGRHTRVYLSNGQMVTPQVALRRPNEVAAANWRALATFACRLAPQGFGLVIDVGSTTIDVVPIEDGQVVAQGRNDTERLLFRELVYAGVQRTPICALVDDVPYRGESYPIAREVFATTRDAYVILGDLNEDSASTATADGRPATKAGARTRLGRMLCTNPDQFNHRDAVAVAQATAHIHVKHLAIAVKHVCARLDKIPVAVILAGEGEFLGRRALRKLKISPNLISISQELSSSASRCAPAHALAVLAAEANVK